MMNMPALSISAAADIPMFLKICQFLNAAIGGHALISDAAEEVLRGELLDGGDVMIAASRGGRDGRLWDVIVVLVWDLEDGTQVFGGHFPLSPSFQGSFLWCLLSEKIGKCTRWGRELPITTGRNDPAWTMGDRRPSGMILPQKMVENKETERA
jgi:hypothetical protein